MGGISVALKMDIKPIVLKELVSDCDISQGQFAKATGLSRATINLAVNRGYIPTRSPDFKGTVEKYIRMHTPAMQWLKARNLVTADIWKRGKKLWKVSPPGNIKRSWEKRKVKALVPGDPGELIIDWEVEMIKQEAMKHFRIFRNPFIDDIQKDSDIFMSEEHRYIEAAMIDAARHGGFLAVVGEVGSGKSVMRRKVVEQLRRDGDVLVIYPQIIDKRRLSAASICDAIIMDISDESPRIKLEQKTRQVQRLLLSRSKNNYRSCLMIEESHDLNVNTLKYLKRFYELEDGYKKLLGIILIGQIELKEMFNESLHVEMREVIRRCQIAEIQGLNGRIKEYLTLKFKLVGCDIEKVFSNDALKSLAKRLTSKDRQGKTISHAYPLLVNNYAAKAMNMAFEMGESKVTEDVVMTI